MYLIKSNIKGYEFGNIKCKDMTKLIFSTIEFLERRDAIELSILLDDEVSKQFAIGCYCRQPPIRIDIYSDLDCSKLEFIATSIKPTKELPYFIDTVVLFTDDDDSLYEEDCATVLLPKLNNTVKEFSFKRKTFLDLPILDTVS